MRRFWPWLILPFAQCEKPPATNVQTAPHSPSDNFTRERHRMVETQLTTRDITDPRVLQAMREVPRHEFVPEDIRHRAYHDNALPIGYDQTISQPYVVALMTQLLQPQPNHRILEIGTGSGYQAAVLSRLVAHVYTIEILEPLAQRATAVLHRLGYQNVHVRTGDGYAGWPEEAPFDAIIVTCAPDHIPQPLIDQLAEGGKMIIPVGDSRGQNLHLLEKRQGNITRQQHADVIFVPMTGQAREPN